MGSGFSKMKKQARLLEEKFQAMQEEKKTQEVTGSSEGNLVSITLTGDYRMKKIVISKECVEDVEGLQDLILSAYHKALDQLDSQEMPTSLMGKMPFFS